MVRVLAVVIGVLAFAAVGCADRVEGVEGGQGLSVEETAWVARYVSWAGDLGEDLGAESVARLTVVDDVAGYRGATRSLIRCSRELAADVGDGPTARTDALVARLDDACRRVERAVTRVAGAYATGDDPVGALVRSAEALGIATDELVEVRSLVDGYSLARRSLPEASWPESSSRLDPELTAAVELVVEGYEAPVRCWSRREWRQVLDEEEALSGGVLSVDTTGAFASYDTREISMQAGDCETIGRAHATGAWWPGGRGERQDLAWSLGVLAHETQHIAGSLDEAETECRGQQRLADVAVALGAPVERARALAELSWRDQYPAFDPDYVTEQCGDGGPYDLRPGVAGRWPWG